ncbi:prepilin-type cleavage/methylation domain-containing protein [Dyella soli]|uniref:Prepilin-type cleavage/methylation domain-containing protein n=2 Tax=Dyella soli TaxID=522319 RepID=A0A4R0YTK7_9GAMM|nr:prepilin-type cleavage/methylation domain-containing protein [Dyella soli]
MRSTHRNASRRAAVCANKSTAGFTLVELMVSMLLGLVVIAGVGSVFLSNQQVYRTNKALGDVQDSSRIAFEMMARDIRSAGLTGCDTTSGRMANVLKNGPNNGGTTWWANWNNTIVGFASSQTDTAVQAAGATRVANTDSLMLLGLEGSGVSVKTDSEPAGSFTINETTSDLQTGDVVVVCDPDHGAVVQLSNVAAGTLTHATSGTPGNCTTDLSYPTVCSSGSSYAFAPNAQIAKLTAADWYVGQNAVGGSSLYRIALTNTAAALTTPSSEMVRNVTAMNITYHQTGNASFVTADLVANWAAVDAVQVRLVMTSTDQRAGTNIKPISRTFTSTTTVRNRVR